MCGAYPGCDCDKPSDLQVLAKKAMDARTAWEAARDEADRLLKIAKKLDAEYVDSLVKR